MTKIIELKAQKRVVAGKGAARKTRDNNLVPAVIYGNKQPAVAISLCFNEVLKHLNKGGFKQAEIHLQFDDNTSEKVSFKDMQLHPVKHMPHHIDFVRAA